MFTGGFAGIGKLPALFGWYIRYGIGIKGGLTTLQIAYEKSGARASGGAGVSCECRQGGMCRGELRILLFSIFGAITVMFSIRSGR